MLRLWVSLIILLACHMSMSPSYAQQVATIEQHFSAAARFAVSQCERTKQYVARLPKSREGSMDAFMLESLINLDCTCMPNAIKRAASALSKEERSNSIALEAFDKKFTMVEFRKCNHEQHKNLYGQGCALRLAPDVSDSASFCACWHGVLSRMTPDENEEFLKLSGAHQQAVKAARAQGLPVPSDKSIFDRFKHRDVDCMR